MYLSTLYHRIILPAKIVLVLTVAGMGLNTCFWGKWQVKINGLAER